VRFLFWDGDVSMGDQWFRNGLRPLMVLAWGFPWLLKTGEADQDFGSKYGSPVISAMPWKKIKDIRFYKIFQIMK